MFKTNEMMQNSSETKVCVELFNLISENGRT